MKGILIVGSCSSGGIACLKYVRVKVGKSLESSTPIFNGSLLSCERFGCCAFCATFWLVANSFFGELSWLRGVAYNYPCSSAHCSIGRLRSRVKVGKSLESSTPIFNKISAAETESQIVKIFCFSQIFRLSVDHC